MIKKVLNTIKKSCERYKKINVEIVPDPKGSKWPPKLLAIAKEEWTVESKHKKTLIMYKKGIKEKEKEKITKKICELLKENATFIIRLFWEILSPK